MKSARSYACVREPLESRRVRRRVLPPSFHLLASPRQARLLCDPY